MKLSSGQDMIRIAICDDQERDAQKALAYTEAYMEQKKRDRYQIRQYLDGRELLEELKKGWNPEILILDVLMDEMDGIALAEHVFFPLFLMPDYYDGDIVVCFCICVVQSICADIHNGIPVGMIAPL